MTPEYLQVLKTEDTFLILPGKDLRVNVLFFHSITGNRNGKFNTFFWPLSSKNKETVFRAQPQSLRFEINYQCFAFTSLAP